MDAETKICKTCGIEKPFLAFRKAGLGRRRNFCAACDTISDKERRARQPLLIPSRAKASYEKHREQRKAGARLWYAQNKERVLAVAKVRRERDGKAITDKTRLWRLELRCEMLEAYGGKCSCCGETEPVFLTLEHTRRDGAEHRRQLGSQMKVYTDLRRRGWPKDGFDILCFNCNCATSRGNICPHKLRQAAE